MLIRKLRLKRGWTQSQLAEIVDVTTRTIQRIEKGHPPSLETRKALAAVFEVDLSSLQPEDTPMTNLTESKDTQLQADEQAALLYAKRIKEFYEFLFTYLVLAAVFQFAHLIAGFRNRDLRLYLQRRFGLSPDEYTAAQLRYDLLKLQAKGWIRKLEGKTLYVLTPKGMVQVTALVKLNQCLNGALGSPPSPAPDVSPPQSELQKAYRRVRTDLQNVLDTLGIAP